MNLSSELRDQAAWSSGTRTQLITLAVDTLPGRRDAAPVRPLLVAVKGVEVVESDPAGGGRVRERRSVTWTPRLMLPIVLPPLQRAVVTLRDIDGLDSATVCHMLEISEANQRTSLHRARSKIRSALERTHQPGVDSVRGSRAARQALAPTAPDLPHRPDKRPAVSLSPAGRPSF